MHTRRLACFILGIWLAAGISVAWLEREDYQTIQDVLSQPDPAVAQKLKALGAHEAYLLMGQLAAQRQERAVETWEDVQLVLGLVFFFFLLLGSSEGKLPLALALVLVAMAVLERFELTPEVLSLARTAGLGGGGASSGEQMRRTMLNSAHLGFEIAKWIVQAALAAVLVLPHSRRSGDAGDQIHAIDKANYRHVNR